MKRGLILISVASEDTERKEVLDALRCADSVNHALLDKGLLTQIIYIEKSDFSPPDKIKAAIKKLRPACIFNLLEGYSADSDKEVEFIKILEDKAVPFTGNSSLTLQNCLNKQAMKDILVRNNISVPQGVFVDNINNLEEDNLRIPLFIKPCFEDASVGIDENLLVVIRDDLHKIVDEKLIAFRRGLLIEEFIPGREFSVGFLGEFPYELLGVSVMDYSQHQSFTPFLTYTAKWESTHRSFKDLLPSCEEEIEESMRREIIGIASQAGKVLGCQGYFRVDLRERNGQLFIIDVNPNPDINKDSGFMRQAYHKGYSYDDVIGEILNSAANRVAAVRL